MRRPLATFFVWTALAATAAAAPPAAAPPASGPAVPVRAKTLPALRDALVRVNQRLAALVADAAMDPGLRRVRTYMGYTDAQLSDASRGVSGGVTVGELLEIAMNKDEPLEVREEAVAAVLSDQAQAKDPDLSFSGRKTARPRVKFAAKAIKYLNDPDLVARKQSSQILQELWPGAGDADIKGFDARKRETWGNARAAWLRFFGL